MTTPAPEAPLTPPVPTQVKQPWRTTVRSVFQFVLALATLLPFIAAGVYNDLDQAPAVVVQILVIAATITRVMAMPRVEDFFRQFLPFLAAQPTEKVGDHRYVERGEISTRTLAIAAFIFGAVALVLVLFDGVRVY
jgi:hypothetical protein